jgi:hypothetical protein
MITTFKNEPIDCDDENYQLDISKFIKTNENLINEFSLDDILTNTYDDIDLNIDDKVNGFLNLTNELFNHSTTTTPISINQRQNDFNIENIFNKLVNNNNNNNNKSTFSGTINIADIKLKNDNLKIKNQKRKLYLQKINNSIKETFISNESSSSSTTTTTTPQQPSSKVLSTFESLKCDFDVMNITDEELLLNKLDNLFSNDDNIKKLSNNVKFSLTRYKCKLNLRRIKRLKRLKLFDIDSYTNELIDSEKSRKQIENNEEKKQHLQITLSNNGSLNTNNNNSNNNEVEIIAVYRVLDRFNKLKKNNQFSYSFDLSYKIGLIEYRNDDIKCIVSPFTKK